MEMKQYEVRIPRLVRMIEWETLTVKANNEDEAKHNALTYENVVSNSEWEDEDHETIETFADEITCEELTS